MEPNLAPVPVRRGLQPAVIGGLGLLVVVGIGAVVWMLLGASRHPAAGLNPGIKASLASDGITVSELPPNTSVQSTRAQAEAVFHEHSPNRQGAATTTVLAKVTFRPNPSLNCTCWLVSLLMGTGIPPGGGPPGGKLPASQFTSLMRYHVTFVDAYTGKFQVSTEGYYSLNPSPGTSPSAAAGP